MSFFFSSASDPSLYVLNTTLMTGTEHAGKIFNHKMAAKEFQFISKRAHFGTVNVFSVSYEVHRNARAAFILFPIVFALNQNRTSL